MTISASSVVIVTGASSGLGVALSLEAARRGAHVVLVARREDRLRDVAQQVADAGGQPHVIVADVSHEHDCYRVIDTTLAEHGRIDVLFNNAGRGNMARVEDTPTEQWHSMFAVNVDSIFWLTARALPSMRARNEGHIIAISSVAGRYGHPLNAAYVAAKHAVVGFIAALRTELVGTNIHATTICPAGIVTEWADATEGGSIGAMYGAAIPKSRVLAREHGLSTAPLSRMMTAKECSDIIWSAVDAGRSDDVYTHSGTKELAVLSAQDRLMQEDKFEALWIAMNQTYEEHKAST
ncbi:MAG: SDR family oxidoreductase [Ignavibacteria bacterium]|nr:SDR family oxidoreductase [Ignavibacteria bacterium]